MFLKRRTLPLAKTKEDPERRGDPKPGCQEAAGIRELTLGDGGGGLILT